MTVEEAIRALGDPDPHVRRDAARALGESGDRVAVPALIAVLRSPRKNDDTNAGHASRAAAAVALGRLGDPAAADALLEVSADPFNLGTAASTALGRLEPPPISRLVAATRSDDGWRRARAVAALGEIGDSSAFPVMVALLRDPEDAVRRAAASAFEKMRDPRAVDPLIEMLDDPASSVFVRTYAAMALGALKNTRAVEPLVRAVASSDVVLRRSAARALCRIDDASSRPLLARLATDDDDKSVRDVVRRYLEPRDGQRGH